MKLFNLRISFLALIILAATSCKNDIITNKLYYGTYESVNKCNKESIELLDNGKYRYKLIHQNKPALTYEDKYRVEADSASNNGIINIVFTNWKSAVNLNSKNNILDDCRRATFSKAVFDTTDVAYFQIAQEDDLLIIKRHPDFAKYDFKKK
ncbi:MAG: hypothetical protein ABIN95_12395 [Mucilaginibacter sp.]